MATTTAAQVMVTVTADTPNPLLSLPRSHGVGTHGGPGPRTEMTKSVGSVKVMRLGATSKSPSDRLRTRTESQGPAGRFIWNNYLASEIR